MPTRSRASSRRRASRIPDGEREHAAETLDARVAPLLVAVHDDFGVRVRPEAMSAAFELGAQRRKVVDLAVEDDPHRVVFVRQRLLPGRNVDDAEPAMGEPDALAEVEAVRVRAAMRDAVAHRSDQAAIDGCIR